MSILTTDMTLLNGVVETTTYDNANRRTSLTLPNDVIARGST